MTHDNPSGLPLDGVALRKAIDRVKVNELPDDMRAPLHSLQADLDYLIARARQEDDEVASIIRDSIRSRLSQIEEAAYRLANPLPAPSEPAEQAAPAAKVGALEWDRRYPSVFCDIGKDYRWKVAEYRDHTTITFGMMSEKRPGYWYESELDPKEALQFALAILNKPLVAALVTAPLPDAVGDDVRAWEYQDVEGDWRLCPDLDYKHYLEREAQRHGHTTPFRPLFAARHRSSPGGGWRSMESAPKDGQKVDIWCKPHDAEGSGNAHRRINAYFHNGDWWFKANNGVYDVRASAHWDVVAWMPAPAAPSPSGKEGE